MRSLFLLILYLMLWPAFSLQAQIHHYFSAGYFGNNAHNYGATIAYDYSIFQIEQKHGLNWNRTYRKREPKENHQLFAGIKEDAWRTPHEYFGSLTTLLVTYRFNHNSFHFDFGTGPSLFFYTHDFFSNDTSFISGKNFAPAPTFNAGFGKKFYATKIPFSIWLKGQLTLQFTSDFDSKYLPAVSLGISFPMPPREKKKN